MSYERCWKAWRALAEAARELRAAYQEMPYHMPWIDEWADRLASECKEHEATELKFMTGHPNPLGMPRER